MDAQTTVAKTKKKSTKILTLNQAEEQHLSAISTSTVTKKKIVKVSRKKSEDKTQKTEVTTVLAENTTVANNTSKTHNTTKIMSAVEGEQETRIEAKQEEKPPNDDFKNDDCNGDVSKKDNNIAKKKTKPKKNKSENQNISVKSSFSKFDALQKRNLIHVRSIDAGTAQEKFSNPQGEIQTNCRLCDKPVYKMEEVKAEKSIYHKNCFRCHECNKQLKVDTYQSHEGVLYCTIHFKLLFAPKLVEDDETIQPRKPELIIRENQPTELPPDVVRASDKPNLGLEELQQLNVRSRFQVFEQGTGTENEELQQQELQRSATNSVVKRSASIMSKVAKLQQLGSSTLSQDINDSSDEDEDIDMDSDNPNADLVRQKRNMQERERPVGLGEAMNDIRTLFEKGHGITKEERREERKQEIQNIRSRLFMGKQARIKEMYQQAVADSEQAITAADKKPDISIDVNSRSLRDRFENGEAFGENNSLNEEGENTKRGAMEKEADVFESAISKKSRSIFMELDANVVTGKNQNAFQPQPSPRHHLQHQKSTSSMLNQHHSAEVDPDAHHKDIENDVVRCEEAMEDVLIQTSEISEKFKFFETYHPTENKKKVFRITPPRDGVVKMPSPDENSNEEESKDLSPDRHVIAHSRTTSLMLDKFRELEKKPQRYSDDTPKPLKCFTPPPDGNRRVYDEHDSDDYETNEDDDNEDDSDSEMDENDEDDGDDEYYNGSHTLKDDEALREAQNAARAKQLRVKFEKWQANEIKHEHNDHRINVYANNISDENSLESTKSIRERFEKMKNAEKTPQPARPRHQVNRFV